MAGILDTLLKQFQTSQEQIQAAQLTREQEIRALIDENIARYMPGGAFQKAALGQLATQKVSDVGAGMQRLVSSGMAGTEAAGGLETGWEQAVGAPARLKLEDLMTERLSQAQLAKAGFIERIEQPYPDYSMIAQLAGQAASGPSYGVDPYTARKEQQIRDAEAIRQSQREFNERWGIGGSTGGKAAPSPTSELGSPAVPQGGRYPTTATQPIKMAAGYGPAFQSKKEMGDISGMRYAPQVGFGAGVAPVPTQPAGTVPTIPQWLEMHGIDPKSTAPADIARAKTLQQQWASSYGKKR